VAVVLRELEPADLPAVVELNNDAVPAVPMADEDELALLTAFASLSVVAVDEDDPDEVLGFLIAMDPGLSYASENYRWFSARNDDFLYVDRIVIGAEARGTGIGRLLYGAVFAKAEVDGRREVTCEVNLRPANPRSLGFHDALGFRRVGEQDTKGGAIRVALLAAPIDGGGES
jgi:predicted GNAT superfamily acetyltransferase